MGPSSPPGPAIYSIVIAVETVGAALLVWAALPVFRQLAMHPGQQPASDSFSLPFILAAVLIMQASYWYRFLRVPIPAWAGPSAVLNHVFVFMARLSFVFGSGLFSLTFFRHLPELDPGLDVTSMLGRGALLSVSLFALFCFTLELERLGRSFER